METEQVDSDYQELGNLAGQFWRAIDSREGGHELQRIVAKMGQVVAGLGATIGDVKQQVDNTASRERLRDLSVEDRRAEEAMRFFALLPGETRERLVLAVENAAPNISVQEFADGVARRADLGSWHVRPLLDAVTFWYDYVGRNNASDDVVDTVASWLADKYTTDLELAGLLQRVECNNPDSEFSKHLKRLIRCQTRTLGITVKAQQLAARHERAYVQARVSTDIRPVFGNNIEAPPEHAIVVHDLMIALREGGVTKSICIGLSSKEVCDLAGVLSRAWSKDRTLRSQSRYTILSES
jgi:hypothetical protein